METDARYFSDAIKNFLTSPQFANLDFDVSIPLYCKTIANIAHVDRVGIWGLDHARTRLTLHAQYLHSTQSYIKDTILPLADCAYFMGEIAAGKTVDCGDGKATDICSALEKSYLHAYNITALLAIPLYCCGRVCGVLMMEHSGPPRAWSQGEHDFAACFGGIASQAFALKDHAPPALDSMALERRTRFYTEHVADWYWETDASCRLLSITSGNTKAGPLIHSLIGQKLWEIPRFVPINCTWNDFRARAQNQENLDDIIFTSPAHDGPQKYGEITARPIYDNDIFIGYWGISRDVTARVQQDLELQASEKKYLNAARLAKVGSWVWDEIEGRVTYCSPEIARIYGIPETEIMARTVARKIKAPLNDVPYEKDLSWVHPNDRDAYRKTTHTASENQAGYDTVVRIIRDDGTIRILHERCEPIFDLTGRFIETTGVIMDITSQEESKRDLAKSRAQIANLMDNIPGAIYRVKNDYHWTPIYTSAGFYGLFIPDTNSAETDPLLPLTLRDLIADADLQMIDEALAEAIETGSIYEFEFPVTRSDGSTVWLSDRGRPVISEDGDIELEGILIDVTKRHEAERALLKAQRLEAIGQLTGGIAHDFNNLLAVILGNLELLRDELSDPDHIDCIDAGIGATWRGAELTKNMLSFARQARLQPTLLGLNTIVADTQKWVSRTLPENIAVQVKAAENLWPMKADQSATESALLNLIVNARDAMPHGGRLVLATSNMEITQDDTDHQTETLKAGRYVVLTVSDTGHGMSKTTIDHIFEPFYTTKSAGSGSGLGLSMIQGFMTQSGGAVRVRSQPDIGTVFQIYFKASRKAGPETVPSIAATTTSVSFEGMKVLVAEDETQVRDVITKTLLHLGCAVTSAANGDVALQLFQQQPDFDLLLTDVVMPGALMGPHLAEAVRKIQPDLPVIFMSGYADEAMVRGEGLRQDDIRLSKPASRNTLIAAVTKALVSV